MTPVVIFEFSVQAIELRHINLFLAHKLAPGPTAAEHALPLWDDGPEGEAIRQKQKDEWEAKELDFCHDLNAIARLARTLNVAQQADYIDNQSDYVNFHQVLVFSQALEDTYPTTGDTIATVAAHQALEPEQLARALARTLGYEPTGAEKMELLRSLRGMTKSEAKARCEELGFKFRSCEFAKGFFSPNGYNVNRVNVHVHWDIVDDAYFG